MADSYFDVVIVGGGPAGSSCGLFLKTYAPQLQVCIIDKQNFPRNKPCGDGLSPAVVDLLADAGLQQLFTERYPLSIFELSSGSFRLRYDLRSLSHNRSVGYVYDRKTFDNELVQEAVARAVTVFQKHTIESIEELNGNTQFHCKHATGNRVITGGIVVGADGAYSKIRSYVGVAPAAETHKGVSLRYYCKTGPGPEPALRIDILKRLGNSYGWVFPLSPTLANVGIGVDADVYKAKNLNLNTEFDAYLAWLRNDMKLEVIEGTRAGYPLPYGTQLPRLAHGNKVLIGDAASMINPLTGEGIYYALYSGQLLARHLAAVFNSGASPATALQQFEQDFKNQFSHHYRLNQRLKKLLTSPAGALSLRVLQHDPVLLHRVMQLVMGNANALDVKHLPWKILKRSTQLLYGQLKKL